MERVAAVRVREGRVQASLTTHHARRHIGQGQRVVAVAAGYVQRFDGELVPAIGGERVRERHGPLEVGAGQLAQRHEPGQSPLGLARQLVAMQEVLDLGREHRVLLGREVGP